MTDRCECRTDLGDGQDAASDSADGACNHRIFVEGDALYDAMMRDIAEARRFILLEACIFWDDYGGETFLSALRQAAERGARRDNG